MPELRYLGQALRDPEFWTRDVAGHGLEVMRDISPVYGDARALDRASEAYSRAGEYLDEGQYLNAAGRASEGLAEQVTTIPGIGEAAGLAKVAGSGLAALGKLAGDAAYPALMGISMHMGKGTGKNPGLNLANETDQAAFANAPQRFEELTTKYGDEKRAAKELWDEAKMYQDMDGNWRKWFSDDQAKLTDKAKGIMANKGRSYNLKSVFDHPEMYEAYPELGKAKIKFVDDNDLKDKGSVLIDVDPKDGTIIGSPQITINLKYFKLPDGKIDETSIMSTIIHESSHIDDARAGATSGGNITMVDAIIDAIPSMKEDYKRYVKLYQKHEKEVEALKKAGKTDSDDYLFASGSAKQLKDRIFELKKEHDYAVSVANNANKHGRYFPYRHQFGGEVRAHSSQDKFIATRRAEDPDNPLHAEYGGGRMEQFLPNDAMHGGFWKKDVPRNKFTQQDMENAWRERRFSKRAGRSVMNPRVLLKAQSREK